MEISSSLFDFMMNYTDATTASAVSYKGKTLSLDEFAKETERVAGGLQFLGVKKGDSVAVCLINSLEAVVAVYAINRAGGIANVIHPKTHPEKLGKLLKETDSRVIFASSIFLNEQLKYFSGRQVIVCGGMSTFVSAINGARSFKRLKAPFHAVNVGGEDIAVYMHSSGTEGQPKTAMMSNRAFNALTLNIVKTSGKQYTNKDAMLMALPIFHGFGFAVAMHTGLCIRAKLVPVPVFRANKIARIVKREKITIFPAIPRMLQKLLKARNFKGAAIKSIEEVYCGGDALSEKVRLQFAKRLEEGGAKARVCRGYGLTEMSSVCVLNLDGTENSIGKPIEGVEVKIVPANDADTASETDGGQGNGNGGGIALNSLGEAIPDSADETGELYMRGDPMMSGYLGSSNGLKEIDGEKWVATGDIVSMDGHGNLFFKGRKKRLIKISGVNVFPLEIEERITSLPFVRESVAVEKFVDGKPRIVVYAVLVGKMAHADEAIIAYSRQVLSRWYVPTEVYIVERLPMTSMGKVDVKMLEKDASKRAWKK